MTLRRLPLLLLVLFSLLTTIRLTAAAEKPLLELHDGDKIVLIGNTLAERMQHFGHWETLLQSRFPQLHLVVRNLGWSADTITLRLRSKDFQDHGHTLIDHQPNVILAFFGYNESFAGPGGVEQFKQDLATFIADARQLKYPATTFERNKEDEPIALDDAGEVQSPPTLVLVSPTANENVPGRGIMAGDANNENLRLYTEAMREVAAAHDVPFVDLFTPTSGIMGNADDLLTINGVHLNEEGYLRLAPILDEALFGQRPTEALGGSQFERLRDAINEKNLQHWYDYRAVNGYYIYGGRKEPFGVVNFPAEFAKLRKMVAVRDQRVWDLAQGKEVHAEIDDSQTGEFTKIETNFENEVHITSPEESLSRLTVPEGFEVQLVASEQDFPELENPVQLAFDGRGRMWVTTIGSYPMYLPGTPVNDKVLIFEDLDGDGKADKQTVFADKLHIPMGIELGYGGVFVSQQPNLMFLQDTDGDDRADKQEIILHGFDSADSHHAISAFEWGPAGELYFQEGTFHHSQIETPYGPERVKNAAVFRYEPRPDKLSVFVSYGFANPWGHVFDRWGQDFVADASGGANYFAAAFSGDVDYPRKHAALKEFLTKQWRPTAGCELVSSRNFPDEMQGDYLLNNCIGFQGVLQYRVKDEGSGFAADPVEPLLRSTDPNFRPVDLQFGPDGALYLIDWFNPLVGHMQHSIRDPNRDQKHGRIWRIVHKNRPLVDAPLIEGRPIEELLNVLQSYEDRTLYAARRELWGRPTDEVLTAVDAWLAGQKPDSGTFAHNQLEGLWLKQAHNVVDAELLAAVLTSDDPRARAAATRVVGEWRDRLDDPLALLQQQINDENPRVRLEAVRALSFFRGPEAQAALDVSVEALLHDMDDYLTYTLNETTETLQHRVNAQ